MAGIVSRKPLTGVAAGIIIGALGFLLLGIDTPAASGRSVAPVLFKTAGYFFLFVSAMAFLGAFLAWKAKGLTRGQGDTGTGRWKN